MEAETDVIRILLIEDDEEDYEFIRECLFEPGDHIKAELEWVHNYRDGLKDIEKGDHDVYLIDHFLASGSGLDLLKEAVKAGCQAPMIMVTGSSDREIDLAALKAGAMDYLVKDRMDGELLERSIRYALERNRLLKKIRELAVRDSLTGLYNRRELHRFLDYELVKSKRYNHPFSVLMMDIDHFKEINDTHGHRVGDQILTQVAQIIMNNTRACDLPARYGGDEFIIIEPETPANQGWFGAERLRKLVAAHPMRFGEDGNSAGKIQVSLSIGVTGFPENGTDTITLIDLADQALYQAKHQGCNCVVRYIAGEEKVQGAA